MSRTPYFNLSKAAVTCQGPIIPNRCISGAVALATPIFKPSIHFSLNYTPAELCDFIFHSSCTERASETDSKTSQPRAVMTGNKQHPQGSCGRERKVNPAQCLLSCPLGTCVDSAADLGIAQMFREIK